MIRDARRERMNQIAARLEWEAEEAAKLAAMSPLEQELYLALRNARMERAEVLAHNDRVDERIARIKRTNSGWGVVNAMMDAESRGLLRRR